MNEKCRSLLTNNIEAFHNIKIYMFSKHFNIVLKEYLKFEQSYLNNKPRILNFMNSVKLGHTLYIEGVDFFKQNKFV